MVHKVQLFVNTIPVELIIDFFTTISNDLVRGNKYFVVNMISYKRCLKDGTFAAFCKAISPCYIPCKTHYVDREHNYSTFLTIIRQCARLHDLTIIKKRGVGESNKSHTIYHIYTVPVGETVETVEPNEPNEPVEPVE